MNIYLMFAPDTKAEGNDFITSKMRLPGVKCSVCHNTWASTRVGGNTDISDIIHGIDPCIDNIAFEKIKHALANVTNGENIISKPGSKFPPFLLNSNLRPINDFIWPLANFFCCTTNVSNILMDNIKGIETIPVTHKIQNQKKKTPYIKTQVIQDKKTIYTSNEPDDRDAPAKYHVIYPHSHVFPESVLSNCKSCGYAKYKATKSIRDSLNAYSNEKIRRLLMKYDILSLESVHAYVINDKFLDIIMKYNLSGLEIHVKEL